MARSNLEIVVRLVRPRGGCEASEYFLEGVPYFQLGLGGPLLQLVLRGGITYCWGLGLASAWPSAKWMLTPEPFAVVALAAGDQSSARR